MRESAFPLYICAAVNFLRVELEESKSVPWEKVVQTAGDGVFTANSYASVAKHLKKKAAKFIKTFTPCVAEVGDAADLLMLPEWAKDKGGVFKKIAKLAKKVKGKRRTANESMCEASGELQQLVRMMVLWWVLGPSSKIVNEEEKRKAPPTVADTFKGARLLFAGHIFNNGGFAWYK